MAEAKRSRGRPPKYERTQFDDLLKEFNERGSNLERHISTVRQQQNYLLALRAEDRLERFLEEMPEEHFSYDGDFLEPLTPRARLASMDGYEYYMSQRVLTELGRCLAESEDLFWRMVDWYAENYFNSRYRLRAADVAKTIREWRLSSEK